jgi:hypothetical protein
MVIRMGDTGIPVPHLHRNPPVFKEGDAAATPVARKDLIIWKRPVVKVTRLSIEISGGSSGMSSWKLRMGLRAVAAQMDLRRHRPRLECGQNDAQAQAAYP